MGSELKFQKDPSDFYQAARAGSETPRIFLRSTKAVVRGCACSSPNIGGGALLSHSSEQGPRGFRSGVASSLTELCPRSDGYGATQVAAPGICAVDCPARALHSQRASGTTEPVSRAPRSSSRAEPGTILPRYMPQTLIDLVRSARDLLYLFTCLSVMMTHGKVKP
jgi:hypothetical protein